MCRQVVPSQLTTVLSTERKCWVIQVWIDALLKQNSCAATLIWVLDIIILTLSRMTSRVWQVATDFCRPYTPIPKEPRDTSRLHLLLSITNLSCNLVNVCEFLLHLPGLIPNQHIPIEPFELNC